MSKGGNILLIIIFVVVAIGILIYANSIPTETDSIKDTVINTPAKSLVNDLTIASWNLQIFGQDKASNVVLMDKYASTIAKYDVVFVQEIRDISETSFDKLCAKLPGYSCLTSSRAGRSSSKESFGMIYRNGIMVLEFTDYNTGDYQNQFERPPIKAIVQIADVFENQTIVKNLTIWENHLKPEDVENEMNYLEDIVLRDTGIDQPWIVLGDLNFACNYADHTKFQPFNEYLWIIPDSADTTVSSTTSCAYDRFISNFGVSEYGIDTSITSDMSDHYLIWLKL